MAKTKARSSRKRKKSRKNPVTILSKKGKVLKGAAAKKALEAGTARIVQTASRATWVKSKAPRTTRAISKLRSYRRAAARAAGKKKAKRKISTAALMRPSRRAPKLSKKTTRWRSKHGYTRGRSYKRGTSYAARPETIKWSEAAYQSGAVYPAQYPSGHPRAGKKHARAGRAMSRKDALAYQIPVVGYLTRGMIKGYWDTAAPGGSLDRKRIRAANKWLKQASKVMRKARSTRGSTWKRAPLYHTRSGKTPRGAKYKKGTRKADYSQRWSDQPAAWQSGPGPHLRTKFKKGRGPVARMSLFRGFGPSEAEVDSIQTGGYGGPLDEPGGVVKLNRGRRRRSRKNAPAKGRKSRVSRRRKAGVAKKSRRRGRRRKASAESGVKVYNNKRRRRGRRRKAKSAVRENGRRRRRRKNSVKANRHRRRGRRRKHAVHENGRRRRGRRRRKHAVKANGRRRGRRRSVRRNPMLPSLPFGLDRFTGQLQKREFWLTVGHVGMGLTGTAVVSSAIQNVGFVRKNLGVARGDAIGKLARFGVNLASAGLVSAGAYAARGIKLMGERGWVNVLVGGGVYSGAMLLGELLGWNQYVPQISVPAASRGMLASSNGSSAAAVSGMGSVLSPEDLVAGESLARNVNEFSGVGDWMELSGLGNGRAVPLEDLRGYPGQYGGGLNDWVELQPSAPLVEAGFDPATESF